MGCHNCISETVSIHKKDKNKLLALLNVSAKKYHILHKTFSAK